MKKIISFLSLCFALALASHATTISYYVSSSGNDANDGLSEANAFANVSAAIDAAQVSFDADNANNNDVVVEVGVGTFTVKNLSFVNNAKNMSIAINGRAADSTIFQAGPTMPANARLCSPFTATNDYLSISFSDLTLENYGFNNTNGGGLFNINTGGAYNISTELNRCMVRNITARGGAIAQCTMGSSFTANDCYFYNVRSVLISNGLGAPINFQQGTLTLKNCVFDRFIKDYANGTNNNGNASIISLADGTNYRSITAEIVNNTFINDSIINLNAQTSDQCGIYQSRGQVDSRSTHNITIANNIFTGMSIDPANNTIANYYDVKVNTATKTINYTSTSNNIMTATVGPFPTTGNHINASYTPTSSEVDFMMDGGSYDYDTTSTGVLYVTANGTLVVDGALSSVQPAKDIVGTTRPASGGCIGAVEYVAPGEQFIDFDEQDAVRYSQASDVVLNENSSAGLPVTYVSSDENVATIVGGFTLHPVGVGKATITANQAGDATYNAAPEIQREVYFAPDTMTYFVRDNGGGTQDGLSEENAFATLAEVVSAANDEGTAITYIADMSGTITGSANLAASVIFSRSEDITFLIKGDDASSAILQMVDDATYASKVGVVGQSMGRFFQAPKNTGTGDLTFVCEDLTIRNFGFTNDNGGGLFNVTTSGEKVDVLMKRCNIIRGAARGGALVQMANNEGSFALEECYVSEMTTTNKNVYLSPIKVAGNNSLMIKNCVFSKCVRAAEVWGSDQSATSFGSVVDYEPNNAAASLSLINNTFIGDSILNETMTGIQSTVYIKPSAAINATIANNLFVGNASKSTSTYYDVNITGTLPTLVNSTHNVMNSQSGLGETANDIDPAYVYDDTSISFTMDGDYPEISLAANGVNYVEANGNSVYGQGLSPVAPEIDIRGEARDASPTVGAYEAGEGLPTNYRDIQTTSITLYPNPTSDRLYVSGQVSSVKVYSIAGLLVKNLSANFTGSIDMSNLRAGIYMVKCEDENGAILKLERIIKK